MGVEVVEGLAMEVEDMEVEDMEDTPEEVEDGVATAPAVTP